MLEFLRKPWVLIVLLLLLILCLLSWYWSREPASLSLPRSEVVGVATTTALIESIETLLNKPGGYLSNDVLPPSALLDNMPNWEFGVLQQSRDLAKTLRNDYSRSQTQSIANVYLERAEPLFNVNNDAWMFPSAEGEYAQGIKLLSNYLEQLKSVDRRNAQFYARADNLNEWLSLVEKRLGSLSQRLSAARPQVRLNTDLTGEKKVNQSTSRHSEVKIKTPWLKIDDNFYEARGTAWALINFLQAAETDFRQVLIDKNALVSLRQIVRELQATQQPVSSLIILNGSGMGMLANHSLVMSSYITRANVAIADLRRLLNEG